MENTGESTEMQSILMKNGLGCTKEELNSKKRRPENCSQEEALDGSLLGVAMDAWYALNVSNNNNNSNAEALLSKAVKQQAAGMVKSSKSCSCEHCTAVEGIVSDTHQYARKVAIETAHPASDVGSVYGGKNDLKRNGVDTGSPTTCRHTFATQNQLSRESTAGFITAASHYVLAEAAASVTPPANSNSNRTSVNNSTDNLSYSSDNYYPDELFVLQSALSTDDIENEDEAEKISLYSDDCVYAYRGDGTDYELTLGTMNNRSRFVDDETDFLEMDFDPDPLSEVECGGVSAGAADVTNNFMQCDDTCLSLNISTDIRTQRQLYNSPIDKIDKISSGLHSQSSLLNKNFARIALHLDQIKADESHSPANGSRRESASLITTVEPASETIEPLAQSLPNSLLATFGRETQEKKEIPTTSPSKITGAKPKRFNTFSTSSSTSSKNSFKSRTSVRVTAASPCNSSSFDERRASCLDFHHNSADDIEVTTIPAANVSAVASGAFGTFHDETCLDCLEKEFLANTIGKELDFSECPKCRRRRSIHRTTAYSGENRCRNSPSHQIKSNTLNYEFSDLPRDSIYPAVSASASTNEFLEYHRNELRDSFRCKRNDCGRDEPSFVTACGYKNDGNQRMACGSHLLKNILTEKETVTLSINNLDEEAMEKALERLHVVFSSELIKSHFKLSNKIAGISQKFKTLKHFILHASKQSNNHPRLKRLIAKATRGQVEVVFIKDPLIKTTEMVPVKVCNILHQWELCGNLEVLKQLDKRFQESNVLGKIANIIRQAQQRCSTRRPLPEFIMIPQYYGSGFLTFSRTC